MLVLWCGADAQTLKKVIGPAISAAGVEHRVETDLSSFPECHPGDVVMAFGSKVLAVLQQLKLVPKGRTVTSMREKELRWNGVSVFCTFDPGICSRDYARLPEIQWDVQLAARVVKTGSTKAPLGTYRWVESLHEIIEEIEAEYAKTGKAVEVACDTETLSLVEYNPEAWIISISFTNKVGRSDAVYFEKGECPTEPPAGMTHEDMDYWQGLWSQLNWLLTSDKISLRGANWKYDSRWIKQKWDILCSNFKFDTLLVGSLLDENRSNSLKLHAKIMTEMGGYEDDMGKYDMGRLDLVPKMELLPYMGGDTDATYRVAQVMKKDLLADKALCNFYIKLSHPASQVFEKVERTGILVDRPYYDSLKKELQTEIHRLQGNMLDCLPSKLRIKYKDSISESLEDGKNPFKTALLKEFLFSPAGLNLKPQMYTEKTKEPATSLDHLMMFEEDPVAANFIGLMREHGSAAKTLSTYVVGFLKHLRPDGRFHPTYLLARQDYGGDDGGTVTGRTSAKDPAVQCCVGETEVVTSEGVRRIDWLVANNGAGLKVLTHTGKFRDIVGVYDNGVQPVYDVLLTSGHRVRCTGNHPILTSEGWVRTDELTPGAICYVTRTPHSEIHQSHLPQLDGHEESLYQRDQQGLGSVRGPWNLGVQPVAGVHQLPCGHGGEAGTGLVDREGGRERQLRAGELSLGQSEDPSQQPHQHQSPDSEREDPEHGCLGCGGWYQSGSAQVQTRRDRNGFGDSLDEGHPAELRVFEESAVVSVALVGDYPTFDLTIDGSHSFVANGIAVHNTIPKHTKWTKRLRRAFIPPKGYTILQLDYSQGELRIAAVVAEEPTMIKAYRDGLDLHAITAAQLNGYTMEEFLTLPEDLRDELRSGGKAGNFGLLYGMQHLGFKEYAFTSYGVFMTEKEAMQKRNAFFDLYSRLPEWHEESKQLARRWGQIRSPLGRVRHLPLITSSDRETRSQSERQAINSPIQSCLSDMMQLAMVHIDREYGHCDIHPFLMTHDSLALYVPEDDAIEWAKRIKPIMENLPLERDFGWNSPLKFIADAEMSVADDLGVVSFATLKKLKGL